MLNLASGPALGRKGKGFLPAMPDEEKEELAEFKVTDRRMFTADGQLRPGVETATRQAEAPPQQPVADAPKARREPGLPRAQPAHERHGLVEFEHLVLSLATTAMFQMGLLGNPGEENPKADLGAAQETIELLTVLQKKTKGNLTKQEESLLASSLFELRMTFVELSRGAGKGA